MLIETSNEAILTSGLGLWTYVSGGDVGENVEFIEKAIVALSRTQMYLDKEMNKLIA